MNHIKVMKTDSDVFFNVEEFVPSLKSEYDKQPLNLTQCLRVCITARSAKGSTPTPVITNRQDIVISDGSHQIVWKAESLTSLFRGNQPAPTLGSFPEAYNLIFAVLELNLLQLCDIIGDQRDAEMKEIYSMLRRRPDGRSMGLVHDYMWQLAAVVLGTHCLSKAQYEAIVSRLERSCRTLEQGPTSRNYLATLRKTIGGKG